MYINIPFSTLMYIACLCPNLVSVHFYVIPILHFNFLFTCYLRVAINILGSYIQMKLEDSREYD